MTRARSDAIMAAYGLPGRRHEAYEIDLLIPLSIGESDDDEDLWPQPRRMIELEWTAERKDDLDAAAQPRVCWPDRDQPDQKAIADDGRSLGALRPLCFPLVRDLV